MKVRFYRWYNALLGAILAFLGYSCSDGPDEYGTPVEYGVPTARYEMKGTVTDEHGAALQGIKVSLKVETERNLYEPIDSTKTDSQGSYLMKVNQGVLQFKGVKLIVEDVDGEKNGGEFQSDTVNVSAITPKKISEGNGHWNMGDYEINANVKLKKK